MRYLLTFYSSVHRYTADLDIKRDVYGISAKINPAALMHLFSNPWFSRLWVVQEAALARTNVVYHGGEICLFEAVMRAAAWLHHKRFSINDELALSEGLSNVSMISYFADQEHGFYNLMHKHRDLVMNLDVLLGALDQFDV